MIMCLEIQYLCCEECNAEYINEEIDELEVLSDTETVTVYRCEVCDNEIFEYNSFELSDSLLDF